MYQSKLLPIQMILVPQGAEYKAVCRGLSRTPGLQSIVVPIPVGSKPLTLYLQKLLADGFFSHARSQVLVMGLCGSLTPHYSVGKILLYSDCIYQVNATTLRQSCDSTLTAMLSSCLPQRVTLVKGLTSDRVIWSVEEKRRLGKQYNADVVDMEGFAILDFLTQSGIAVSMLRVVSDDCQHNIPDLNSCITPDGNLQPLSLASRMIRQPIAATRLIRGSLQALKILQNTTTALFTRFPI